VQREIAWDFTQDVADEKDAGAEAKYFRRESEILVHGERGEADIDPVEEIHGVAEDEEGDEAPARLGDSASRLISLHSDVQLSGAERPRPN
jgi:hypothetical protein